MTKTTIPVCYGYQGKGNIGDNLMFLLNTAGHAQVHVKRGRKARPNDIELGRLAYFWRVFTAREMIFSGGNIFNVDRWRSNVKILGYYLLVKTRRLLGGKTSFLSIGVNKNTKPFIYNISVRTILSADYAHLRETSITGSAMWQRLAHRQKVVEFKPDVVFTGDIEALPQVQGFRDRFAHFAEERYALYFPSYVARREAWQQSSEPPEDVTLPEDLRKIHVVLQGAADIHVKPAFFAGREVVMLQSTLENTDEVLARLVHADLVVTERYHGAILAKRYGIPMIASGFSEKLRHIEMVS